MSRAFSRIGLFLIQIHLKNFFPRKKGQTTAYKIAKERQKYRFMDDICYLKNQSTGLHMSVYPEFA